MSVCDVAQGSLAGLATAGGLEATTTSACAEAKVAWSACPEDGSGATVCTGFCQRAKALAAALRAPVEDALAVLARIAKGDRVSCDLEGPVHAAAA
jgi:hypothetical protein